MSNQVESSKEMKAFWYMIERQAKSARLNIENMRSSGGDVEAAHATAVNTLSELVNEAAPELNGVE